MAKELTAGLVRAGHRVDVLTTSLETVDGPPRSRFRSSIAEVDGVSVRYLATPLRYRWMGITPTLPAFWPRRQRPDVVHVFGFRDVVTTFTGAWARALRIPYVFEPLDMFVPRYRNVALKRAFDRLLGGPVARGAAVVVANSAHERAQLAEAGLAPARIETRPNGFPPPAMGIREAGALRRRIGLAPDEQLVLNVGRVSFK
jgi:glycosyltransferase involved in cell wall biosynthesis